MAHNHKCLKCDTKFKSKKKTQKYCSRECYDLIQKDRIPHNKIIHDNKCNYCKKRVNRIIEKGSNNIYCSRACYLKVHKEKTKIKECLYCNNKFESNSQNKDNKYCCNQCMMDDRRLKSTSENNIIGSTIDRKFFIKRCKECSSIFYPKKAQFIMCSSKCVSDNFKNNESRKEKISLSTKGKLSHAYIDHPLRDKKRDKPSYTLKKHVYSLFGNSCFNCGSENDLSIDHHTPNIKGGMLNDSNAVLLCRKCNSKKKSLSPSIFYNNKQIIKLEKMGIVENSLLCFI